MVSADSFLLPQPAAQIATLPGNGRDEQMFGDEQQIPHGEQNDEEADCHERVSTGERPWLVGKARAGCSVGQPALMSSPQHMEYYNEDVTRDHCP